MEKGGDRELKHLGFVRVLALNALVLVSYLYEFAKEKSGPLKSPVETVEKVVSTVVSPVYERVKGIPEDILVFVDNKVDEAINKFAPPLVKKVVSEVHAIIEKVSNLAKNIIKEFLASGLKAAISYVGVLAMQFAMSKLAEAWFKIDQNPALHVFAELVVPTAGLLLEKYNNVVLDLASKSYAISSYLPLAPVEEMANAFKQVEADVAKKLEATTSDILAGVANKLEGTSSDILTSVAASADILAGVANKLEATSSDILGGVATSSDILAGVANKVESTSSGILAGVANKVEATSSSIFKW